MGISGHFEDATLPYFCGVSPGDRLLRAGFPSNLGYYEILTSGTSVHSTSVSSPFSASEALGAGGMRNLIETVYHALGAFAAGRNGGVGASSRTGPHSVGGTPTA